MRLKDKVAIITGSGRGIGRAEAVAFAREGAKIVIAEIDSETMNDAAKEIKAMGQECIAVKTDVAVKAEVEQMVQKTINAFSKVDILIVFLGSICRWYNKTQRDLNIM